MSKFNQLIDTNKNATYLEKVYALYTDQKERAKMLRKTSFAVRLDIEASLQHSEQTIARMEIRNSRIAL